jgi:eukaryotic-like serine/threonine-protein kinase
MAFSVGDRLGRYEILGALGAGGMGEVYRARDHQLERDVAIKVLAAAFSHDPERRRRFEQEARAAGGLNHPNILAVYDIGTERGSTYVVTELLEGGTLRERMAGRPLPVAKVVDYARQIAAGLATAHERGVVHRDIKPANLFVTSDGRIKILDFGLAKLIGGDSSLDTDTIVLEGSRQTVLGTVAYMSPERARGLRVDHRTDVFSFGVVLYEMLTGFPPFQRITPGDTFSAILHDEPAALPRTSGAIPALDRIVRHCLEKQPEERFQNFRDLLFHLDTRSHDSGAVEPGRLNGRFRPSILIASGLLVLSAAAGIAFVATQGDDRPPLPPRRVRAITSAVGLEESPAISPDGKMVAFTASRGGRRQVYVSFNRGEPVAVTGDDADHQAPRWLPDGSSLIYFSPAASGQNEGEIYKIPALGGARQRMIASLGGGDVSRGGRLTCFRLEKERIQLVTASLDGSDVQIVTTLETRHYRYPRWSPDGRWIAFQAGDGYRSDVYFIAVQSDSTPVKLTDDNKFIEGLAWLPDSSGVVYASSRGSTVAYLPPLALWEVSLDRRQPQRQLTPPEASYYHPDVHGSGVVTASRLQMRFDLWRYPFGGVTGDVAKGAEQVTHQTGHVSTPTAAPDGDQIAYLSDRGGHSNIWVMSAHGPSRPITFEDDPGVAIGVPIWSPDGRWIAFVSTRGNVRFTFGIWLVRPDGSELHQIVPRGLGVAWSPTGEDIYYVETASSVMKKVGVNGGEPVTVRSEPVRNLIGVSGSTVFFLIERALMDGRPEFEIRAAPLGNGPARLITTIEASRVAPWQAPFNPALSPDGKWLAMPLTDGFTTNIWAMSTDNGRLQQVTDFSNHAIFIARRVSWSADGRSILAAIGEGDADISVHEGLVRGVAK